MLEESHNPHTLSRFRLLGFRVRLGTRDLRYRDFEPRGLKIRECKFRAHHSVANTKQVFPPVECRTAGIDALGISCSVSI